MSMRGRCGTNDSQRRGALAVPLPPANPRLIVPQGTPARQPRWPRSSLQSRATSDPGDARTAAIRLEAAVWGLWRRAPELSAWRPLTVHWQRALGIGLVLAAIGVALAAPEAGIVALSLLLAGPFLCLTMLRVAALVELVRQSAHGHQPRHHAPSVAGTPLPAELPSYSVLVPLHDEAAVLPALVRSLLALDYPAERLEILLVLEADDRATGQAAAALALPDHIRIVAVPPGEPRTKPKALNYALGLARGDYLVVFDAEDRPEPGQLRAALARFAAGGPELACVQARLNIYNPYASFLTRQFTLEYSALFDATLPCLARLGLPLPLGGTSNHFRTSQLRDSGGWDPFNVTEDADLGIRLARLGLSTATIASTTWEEAPPDLDNWRRQRTRWLKGWTQTWAVHMRQPGRLLAELGGWRFAGLQLLMGAILVAALAHPLVYVLAAHEAWSGRLFAAPSPGLSSWLWWTAVVNLALGCLTSMALGALAVIRRGRPWLAVSALLMPIYWLLISAAGYRALWQLARQPYLWEKTRHGGRETAMDDSNSAQPAKGRLKGGTKGDAGRRERLAAELRQNLKRRKDRARAVEAEAAPGAVPAGDGEGTTKA